MAAGARARVISVSTNLGMTAVTVIPCRANSRERDFVKPM